MLLYNCKVKISQKEVGGFKKVKEILKAGEIQLFARLKTGKTFICHLLITH